MRPTARRGVGRRPGSRPRAVALAEPDRRRVGHVRSRRRGRGAVRSAPASARSRSKSVAAFAWTGNPPLRVAEAPGGGMLNSVGLAGPGHRRVDRATTFPRSKRTVRASSRRSGVAPSRSSRRPRRRCKAVARPRRSRSRSTCQLPERRGRGARVFAHAPRPTTRRDRTRCATRSAARCPCSRSCRRTSPTSSRSRAPRSTRAPTGSRWSTR